MDKGDDPYQILGLSKSGDTTTITTSAIKKAYRELARIYHPDKNKHADASTKFAKISHAYDILKDDESRHSYDLSQQHNQKGYDPNGPTYSSSSSSRATPTTTPSTTTTTTRTTTTRRRTPMTTSTRRTTIPTRKTYTNAKRFNGNTDAYNGGELDDTIQSMSSKERTVINPITKGKEVITEITVTKFDGSVEVRTEKRQQQTHQKIDNTMKIRTPKSNKKKESTKNIEIKKKKDKKKKKKGVKKVEKDDEQQQPIPMGPNKTAFMNSPTGIATDIYTTTITLPSSASSNTTKTETKKKKKVIPSSTTTKMMMPSSNNSTNVSTNINKPKRKTQNTKLVHHRTTNNNNSTKNKIDDDVQSMSTKERTVMNPLTKHKERVIETTVTKFDGSVEVRTARTQL